MKKSTLALVVMGIVASVSVQAAEIYNKDGNKLDVYGKVKAMHYMSDNDSKDGDQSYIRFGFKGETQINDQLTGYGRWEAEFAVVGKLSLPVIKRRVILHSKKRVSLLPG